MLKRLVLVDEARPRQRMRQRAELGEPGRLFVTFLFGAGIRRADKKVRVSAAPGTTPDIWRIWLRASAPAMHCPAIPPRRGNARAQATAGDGSQPQAQGTAHARHRRLGTGGWSQSPLGNAWQGPRRGRGLVHHLARPYRPHSAGGRRITASLTWNLSPTHGGGFRAEAPVRPFQGSGRQGAAA